MILADKIINLRKKNGWSQQELAEKVNVSRQSVSKWESSMSVPDLDKILQLGNVFGVSTDYLLKDEIEKEDFVETLSDTDMPPLRRVTLSEANEFLQIKFAAAGKIAFGVFICIISPICLILLGAASSTGMLPISENAAGGIGLLALFILITAAVAIFITSGMKSSKYEFLDKEPIETEYGVTSTVKEKYNAYADTHTKNIVLGTCLCILSVVPLFTAAFLSQNDFYAALALCLTFIVAGIGVMLIITSGIKNASMQKLLEEGDYTKTAKKRSTVTETVGTVYWLAVTAIYLGYSFHTNEWQSSWIIWPVAGVIFAGIMAVCSAVSKREKK